MEDSAHQSYPSGYKNVGRTKRTGTKLFSQPVGNGEGG